MSNLFKSSDYDNFLIHRSIEKNTLDPHNQQPPEKINSWPFLFQFYIYPYPIPLTRLFGSKFHIYITSSTSYRIIGIQYILQNSVYITELYRSFVNKSLSYLKILLFFFTTNKYSFSIKMHYICLQALNSWLNQDVPEVTCCIYLIYLLRSFNL